MPHADSTSLEGAASGKGPVGPFRFAHGAVKAVAILGGGPLTVISLMSVVGLMTGNVWVRLAVALVVAIGLPLVVVERLLPEGGDLGRGRGLPTDVFALAWLGFAVAFVGGALQWTRPMLLREADRQWAAGWDGVARATYFLVRARPVAPVEGSHARREADGGGGADGGAADGAAVGRPDGGAGKAPDRADAGAAARRHPDADAPRSTSGATKEHTPTEIFSDYAPAVVTITTALGDEEFGGGGTGFIIDRDGTIATNHHVIRGAGKIAIKLFDGTVINDGEVLAEDRDADLALLRVKTSKRLKVVALGDSDHVAVAERVVVIGNPLGLEHTVTDGLVSARRIYEGKQVIQISAPVSPGNSGGPVFDMRGTVVGIATAQIAGFYDRAQNLNLAVPINDLKAMIRSEYPARRPFGQKAQGSSRW